MVIENDVYDRLARWLRTPNAPSFIKVLEIEITPEEAALVLELPQPATAEQLAKRLNIDEEKLLPQLEELVNRGWLRSTKDGYYAPPANPRFMPRITLPGISEAESNEAWKNFYYQDWRRILVEEKERQLEVKGFNQWRIAPSGKALAASPGIRSDQIMRCEDVRDMVRRATDITVHECGCREKYQNCDRPLLTCLRAVWVGKVDTSDEKTGGHENQIHISAERAIEIMDEAEESGLVHTLLNAAQMGNSITICSCCPCCCYLLNPVLEVGKVHKLIEPSRFRAVIDEEKCQGCQTCVERCHFDAIEMRKVPGSKKLKAFVINENCLGCGVCVLKCPNNAIRLETARPPAHIPMRPMSEASTIPSRLAEA
jgi:NAD-dependent dihydropyrimidine dehydrogenase PreA subunit